MKHRRLHYLIIAFGLLLTFNSCREVTKLRSSVRRTQSQFRFFERSVNKATNKLGIETKDAKEQDSTSGDYFPLEQKNMLNSYGYLYDAINGKNDLITSSNFTWDSTTNKYYVQDAKYRHIKDNKEVFGWHPYWMGNAWENYSFELLSTITYFSYKLDPYTGSYSNPEQMEEWRTTAMIDSAKAKKTKVLLTVSSHGKRNNDMFLEDEGKWNNLIDSLTSLVSVRKADGVDLNFEQLSYFKRRNFNRFVKLLRTQLDARITYVKPIISVTLPAVDSREIFDIDELDKYADLFVIMGYDYNSGSQVQGAVAPLVSVENIGISLSNTLEFYLGRGLAPDKTVLALPYYGSMWEGNIDEGGVVSSQFERKVTYREIMNIFNDKYIEENNIEPILQRESMTNYFNLNYPDNTSFEIWFDDAYTLGKKYDYALSKDLKGIGIWALGYDNGHVALWDLIEEKFASDTIEIENPIAQLEGYPFKASSYLLKNKKIILVASLFLLFAIVIALVITLNDWKVRDSIIRNLFHRVIFIVLIYLFVTPLVYLINELFYLKSDWKYYVTFLIGIIAFYLSTLIRINPFKKP